ncbi:site-specific integrase [Lacticaseibacillus saniviri]|uniref:site-specific integrase n=1 Tax=Lacticaseibacillus saniviri TaxID=931533 RepID=UPI001EE0913D|nr:site-specific integrase [Lacticaseibacillus saniviri]MCG4280872.1 site-specific integrase [Lacticaseibacillus saniviri]
MASIKAYQLKNGEELYRAQVYAGINPATGKQVNFNKRGFRSMKAAKDWARKMESSIADNQTSTQFHASTKLSDWLTDWIENYKTNVKEGSMIIYRYNIKRYLIPNIGKYTFSTYTPMVHQKFINELLKSGGKNGQPLSYSTVIIINSTLSNAFERAKKLNLISYNPTTGVEFPRSVTIAQKHDLHYWSSEEADKFLDQAKNERDPVWYVFFLTLLDLGLRKGEAMALQWQDIDFVTNTVTISKTRLYRAETGDHANDVIVDDPKFPASNRTLYMSDRLKDALLQFNELFYPSTRIVSLSHDTKGTDDLIFRYSWSEKANLQPLRDRSTNGAFERIRKRASLPKITIHDLRHTHAVLLRESGVPLEDIKDILGHKDIATTQIYAEITPQVIKDASKKYNEYISRQ